MSDPADMVSFCVYVANGSIVRFGTCPRSMLTLQAMAGETAVEAKIDDNRAYWFDGSAVVAKFPMPTFTPASIPADGIALSTAYGVPNPTTVTISGAATDSFIVTDGLVALSFDAPGDYRVRLEAGPAYLITEETIVAT